MSDVPWFVYLLECRGGRIYTGVSNRVARRIQRHRAGKGAMFTRLNRPERLLAAKPFASRREAQQVECQVKRLPSQAKRLLAHRWSQEHPVDQIAKELLAFD